MGSTIRLWNLTSAHLFMRNFRKAIHLNYDLNKLGLPALLIKIWLSLVISNSYAMK